MTIRYWIIQNFIPKSTKKKIEIIIHEEKDWDYNLCFQDCDYTQVHKRQNEKFHHNVRSFQVFSVILSTTCKKNEERISHLGGID